MGRGVARRVTLRAAQGRETTQGHDLYLVGGSHCLSWGNVRFAFFDMLFDLLNCAL